MQLECPMCGARDYQQVGETYASSVHVRCGKCKSGYGVKKEKNMKTVEWPCHICGHAESEHNLELETCEHFDIASGKNCTCDGFLDKE